MWTWERQADALDPHALRGMESYFRVFQDECQVIKVAERQDNLG